MNTSDSEEQSIPKTNPSVKRNKIKEFLDQQAQKTSDLFTDDDIVDGMTSDPSVQDTSEIDTISLYSGLDTRNKLQTSESELSLEEREESGIDTELDEVKCQSDTEVNTLKNRTVPSEQKFVHFKPDINYQSEPVECSSTPLNSEQSVHNHMENYLSAEAFIQHSQSRDSFQKTTPFAQSQKKFSVHHNPYKKHERISSYAPASYETNNCLAVNSGYQQIFSDVKTQPVLQRLELMDSNLKGLSYNNPETFDNDSDNDSIYYYSYDSEDSERTSSSIGNFEHILKQLSLLKIRENNNDRRRNSMAEKFNLSLTSNTPTSSKLELTPNNNKSKCSEVVKISHKLQKSTKTNQDVPNKELPRVLSQENSRKKKKKKEKKKNSRKSSIEAKKPKRKEKKKKNKRQKNEKKKTKEKTISLSLSDGQTQSEVLDLTRIPRAKIDRRDSDKELTAKGGDRQKDQKQSRTDIQTDLSTNSKPPDALSKRISELRRLAKEEEAAEEEAQEGGSDDADGDNDPAPQEEGPEPQFGIQYDPERQICLGEPLKLGATVWAVDFLNDKKFKKGKIVEITPPATYTVKFGLFRKQPGTQRLDILLRQPKTKGKFSMGSFFKSSTDIYTAAINGDIQSVLEAILKNPDVVDKKGGKEGKTALWYAAKHGKGEVIKLLLRYGAEDDGDGTTLKEADPSMRKVLLNFGWGKTGPVN